MQKAGYIIIFPLLVISFFIYWCWLKSQSGQPGQTEKISNKYLKKYYELSASWDIQEQLHLNLKWETQNTILNLVISSESNKNIFSWTQNGKYRFQMQTENKNFSEKESLSWTISILSQDNQYFFKSENTTFIWPKWKISNKNIENKISEINNKRIKIDKDIPFVSTSESLFFIQKTLNYLLRTGTDKINLWLSAIKPNNSGSFNSDNKGEIYINWKYSNTPINAIIAADSWIFYFPVWQNIQIYTKATKLWFTLSWYKSDIILDINVKKTKKSLILKFQWNIVYDKPLNQTQEKKLDIKWEYTIKASWYRQIDLPTDYLSFTQTMLTKN